MLIEFSVTNFRSIREQQVLSLLATSERSLSDNKIQLEKYKKMSILNSVVVFGANGSGKTNLIVAFDKLRQLIYFSDSNGPEQKISQYLPFRLDGSGKTEPTTFEIEFLDSKGIRYFYSVGFNESEILSEKLLYYPRVKEIKVFERKKGESIDFGDLPGSKRKIESLLGKNQLFLSKAAKSNNEFMENVFNVFQMEFDVINSKDHFFEPISTTVNFIRRSDENKEIIKALLQAADLSIEDIVIKKHEVDEKRLGLPENMPNEFKNMILENASFEPRFKHKVFDQIGKLEGTVEFHMSEESDGTVKLFQLAARIIRSLESGGTLFIDEINNGLHPILGLFIVELFHNKEVNTKNAQLIFTTHDTNYLEEGLFRRDQVWFVEKDQHGKSSIYSLSEFNDDKNLTRKNRKVSIRNWYLSGRFGGVPVIRDLLLKRRSNGKT